MNLRTILSAFLAVGLLLMAPLRAAAQDTGYHAQVTYTSSGGVTYSIPFPYFQQADIVVFVGGVLQPSSAYTFPSTSVVQLVTAPGTGEQVQIRRATSAHTAQAVFNGGTIASTDLNRNQTQNLYLAEEAHDNYQRGVDLGVPITSQALTVSGTITYQTHGVNVLGGLSTTPAFLPQAYGAQGNSSGTHGTGHDDTAALQAAINAAAAAGPAAGETGSVVELPCGVYRITSGLTFTGTFPATYSIIGHGACSQIYFDTTSLGTLFTFSPSSCQSAPPCLVIKNLNFIPPNNAGSTVLATTNEPDTVFSDNIIQGWRNGWVMTTSYAPTFMNNFVINLGGAALVCVADASCNNAIIWNNKIFSSGADQGVGAFRIGGNSNNVSFKGNDLEGNYGGLESLGITSLDAQDNYIERNTNFGIYAASGSNSSWRWQDNWFFNNGGSHSWDAGTVDGLVIEGNTWNTQTLTLTTATNVSYGLNTLQTTVSLARYCDRGSKCAYTRSGVLLQWGTATTSSATPGTVSITYPIACPTALLSATATSSNGASPVATSVGTSSTTGMTLFTATGPATVNWEARCQ